MAGRQRRRRLCFATRLALPQVAVVARGGGLAARRAGQEEASVVAMLLCAAAAVVAALLAPVGRAAAESPHAAAAPTSPPVLLDDRGSFENFALGRGELCANDIGDSLRNYRCLKGADHNQSGPASSTVVGRPEPVRSGKHSLRSGPFNFSEGYRVEVIPRNRSEPSAGDM
eukprot:COSAG02_NODE_28288_length_592_cov_0.979716_1_plen_170_part_01